MKTKLRLRVASENKKWDRKHFKKGNTVGLHTRFKKGIRNTSGTKGKHWKHTLETIEKLKKASDGHHIWYEDNKGNPTDKGLWFVSKKLHGFISQLLKHNRWTDNRRYLAG